MSVHQCPKCELRFERKTELEDHCAADHPQFRHEYPAEPPAALAAAEERVHGHEVSPTPLHLRIADAFNWLVPGKH